MLKFNNQHIITGYIKQLLANFNLPKYYKYDWPLTKKPNYYYNKPVLNQTKNFEIRSNIYDTYTHEYLGEYLRFQRDYNHINLMSLYNCFSNSQPAGLELIFNLENDLQVSFTTEEVNTKIYMVPVKFGTTYTIALDSDTPVELCCGRYGKYYYTNDETLKVEKQTYKKFNKLSFTNPILFTITSEDISDFDYEHEQDLKLFIKMSLENNSSIAILEGNYLNYNDSYISYKNGIIDKKSNQFVVNFRPVVDQKEVDFFDSQYEEFKPISRLQLLTLNTEVSYPFADALVEYLTGMAVTNEDELIDNILRIQEVMKLNYISTGDSTDKEKNAFINFDTPGAWSDKMRAILYTDRFNSPNGNGKAGTLNTFDLNCDNLGYLDKIAESTYKGQLQNEYNIPLVDKNNKPTYVTIENVDLYPNIYKDSKDKR